MKVNVGAFVTCALRIMGRIINREGAETQRTAKLLVGLESPSRMTISAALRAFASMRLNLRTRIWLLTAFTYYP